jgi:Cys-tRNA(Pro)/Cys-tRNA(Cys) deacylase
MKPTNITRLLDAREIQYTAFELPPEKLGAQETKKVVKATEREAERLTGLQAGGISPLALINRGFQVVIHSSARTQDKIHVSGGKRGLNIQLSPLDLATLTNASFADICTTVPEG